MMPRRFVAILSAAVIAGSLSAAGEAAADPADGTIGATRSHAGGQELSVTSRLADRREVAAGTRAYSIGFEDGRFYANGWHITGEMGGVWTPPIKLLDGVWFGLDDQWVGPATSSPAVGATPITTCPNTAGLSVARTDFVPDGTARRLFGLTITNPGAARTGEADSRRAFGADGPVPVGLHRGHPERQRQHRRQGQLTTATAGVHRRRRAAGRADPPLRGAVGTR